MPVVNWSIQKLIHLSFVSRTFNPDWTLADRKVIEEDTILVLDPDTGDVISGSGKNMFYVPHGLTLDGEGNTYVTDTGLHQVMRVSHFKR